MPLKQEAILPARYGGVERDRKWRDQANDFILRLTNMHHEAMRLGFITTGHALHEAVKRVGYEMAGTPELYDKIEAAREKARP